MFTQTIDDIEIMTKNSKRNCSEVKAYLSLVCDSRVDKDRIQHIRDFLYGSGMTARSGEAVNNATTIARTGSFEWMYFVTSFRDVYICKMCKYRELKKFFHRGKEKPQTEDDFRVLLRGGDLRLLDFTDTIIRNFTV